MLLRRHPGTMSKKVSKQPEGVTLLECINESAVPFSEQNVLRSVVGVAQTDRFAAGQAARRSTSSADEVALWRAVMDFLHDVR